MTISEIIKSIRQQKGVSISKLSKRTGIASPHLASTRVEKATIPTLKRICDGLGVELCIIDGWKKYKLNDFPGVPEIDILFSEMNKVQPNRDRYEEREDERKVKAEIDGAIRRTYCRGCKWCDTSKERGGHYWCGRYGTYRTRKECDERIERDIQEVFRKEDVRGGI